MTREENPFGYTFGNDRERPITEKTLLPRTEREQEIWSMLMEHYEYEMYKLTERIDILKKALKKQAEAMEVEE